MPEDSRAAEIGRAWNAEHTREPGLFKLEKRRLGGYNQSLPQEGVTEKIEPDPSRKCIVKRQEAINTSYKRNFIWT